eukprot:1189401-Prorocentrum_minimum.AAC.2
MFSTIQAIPRFTVLLELPPALSSVTLFFGVGSQVHYRVIVREPDSSGLVLKLSRVSVQEVVGRQLPELAGASVDTVRCGAGGESCDTMQGCGPSRPGLLCNLESERKTSRTIAVIRVPFHYTRLPSGCIRMHLVERSGWRGKAWVWATEPWRALSWPREIHSFLRVSNQWARNSSSAPETHCAPSVGSTLVHSPARCRWATLTTTRCATST